LGSALVGLETAAVELRELEVVVGAAAEQVDLGVLVGLGSALAGLEAAAVELRDLEVVVGAAVELEELERTEERAPVEA